MPDARILRGDCLEVLPTLPEASADSVVTDPPYEFGFMGKAWDRTGVAFRPEAWAAVLRVAKPGAYLLAFGGTRTHHRLTCAIEDAGWEIRDCLMWLYGSGWPKGKGCLKPAYEPIVLARKPGPKVLPLNIDECRVECADAPEGRVGHGGGSNGVYAQDDWTKANQATMGGPMPAGRWPANVVHDGSDEVLGAFAAFGETRSNKGSRRRSGKRAQDGHGKPDGYRMNGGVMAEYGDTGTAARFFYCAKASKSDRGEGNAHPTVKPSALMRHLVRLVTPAGGTVMDPFAGSGSTGVARVREGLAFVGVELDAAHCEAAKRRVEGAGAAHETKPDRVSL
jgi:site-specific DNA-methyltransferase (adenine-specific)